MLEKEFQYYLDNQNELVNRYNGKYLVIMDNEVVGVYNSDRDALSGTEQNGYKLGTFLVQKCSPGDTDYSVKFHSRVRFV